MTVQAAAAGNATWTAPMDWEKQPDQAMRVATYKAGKIEVIITKLAQNNIGELLPNINRWRGMAGMEALADAKEAHPDAIKVGGQDGAMFDFNGPTKRVRVAMVPSGDDFWFFRFQGPSDEMDAKKPSFDAFLASVKFDGEAAPPAAAETQAAAAAEPMKGSAAGINWMLPGGWTQQPAKQMRVASFFAGDAEVIVTQFEKDNIGDLLMNINRWRGMAGLDRISDLKEANPAAMTVGGQEGKLYDFANPSGAGPVQHVKVAMIPVGNLYWFVRFQGSTAAVAKQQQSFEQFLKSITFGGSK